MTYMVDNSNKSSREFPQFGCNAAGSARILVIEDDPAMGDLLAEVLVDAGYQVTGCFNPEEVDFSTLFSAEAYDVVISDICMPKLNGFDILDFIKSAHRQFPVILITALSDSKIHKVGDELGASTILDKPFEMSTLIDAVDKAVGKSRNSD